MTDFIILRIYDGGDRRTASGVLAGFTGCVLTYLYQSFWKLPYAKETISLCQEISSEQSQSELYLPC